MSVRPVGSFASSPTTFVNCSSIPLVGAVQRSATESTLCLSVSISESQVARDARVPHAQRLQNSSMRLRRFWSSAESAEASRPPIELRKPGPRSLMRSARGFVVAACRTCIWRPTAISTYCASPGFSFSKRFCSASRMRAALAGAVWSVSMQITKVRRGPDGGVAADFVRAPRSSTAPAVSLENEAMVWGAPSSKIWKSEAWSPVMWWPFLSVTMTGTRTCWTSRRMVGSCWAKRLQAARRRGRRRMDWGIIVGEISHGRGAVEAVAACGERSRRRKGLREGPACR